MKVVTENVNLLQLFFDRQKFLYIFFTIHKALNSDEIVQNILSDAHERVDFLTLFLVETVKNDAIMCTWQTSMTINVKTKSRLFFAVRGNVKPIRK